LAPFFGNADLEHAVPDLRLDSRGVVRAGKLDGAAELASWPFEPVRDAACVQAVATGAFDRQRVRLRGDVKGFGFDAGQIGEDDVFVGEFADVDVWRPCAISRDVGKWQEGFEDGLLDGHRAHLFGWCWDRCALSRLAVVGGVRGSSVRLDLVGVVPGHI
jgi:hypothetical protein